MRNENCTLKWGYWGYTVVCFEVNMRAPGTELLCLLVLLLGPVVAHWTDEAGDEWVVLTRTKLPHHELRHSLVRYYAAGGQHLYVLRGDGQQIRKYMLAHGDHHLSPNTPFQIDVYTGSGNVTVAEHMTRARADAAAAQWGNPGGYDLTYPRVVREARDLAAFVSAEPVRPSTGYRGFRLQMQNGTGTEVCRTNSNVAGRMGYSAGAFSWGIDRVDRDSASLDYNFCSGYTGNGTHIYILDTGVAAHNTFGARVEQDWSWYTPDMRGNGDLNGHGTHVAGTAASSVYGSATRATVHNVQVLDGNGQGTFASVAAGLMYIYENASLPGVINMSLGGRDVYIDAVAQLIQVLYDDLKIISVVSAGNSASDACRAFPAAVPTAFTVAASRPGDALSGFSNYGTCVDAIAPGSDIISSTGSEDAAVILSGTSMAAPVVTGLISLVQDKIQRETDPVRLLAEEYGSTAAYHAYYGTRAYTEYQHMNRIRGALVPSTSDVLNLLLHDAHYAPFASLPSGTPNIMPLVVRTDVVQYPVEDPPPIPIDSHRPSATELVVSIGSYSILLVVTSVLFA